MKLYRSRKYPNRWYAHCQATGWVMFPCTPGGWEMRQPARGIDPVDIREVPVQLGMSSGVPESQDELVLSPEAA